MKKKNKKKLVKELRAEIVALEKENMEKTNTITSFNVDIRRLKEQVSDLTELIEQDTARECGCFTLCNDSAYKEAGITQKKIDMLPRGAVLGTVTLTNCFVIDEAYRNYIRENHPNKYAFSDYSIGRYAWIFEEPMESCLPVRASGRSCPGLWNW